jgi:ABC-type dipeptide/oligopeptide/nickel transport system ATPase component
MLIEVEDLVTEFSTKRGTVHAVDHVSFCSICRRKPYGVSAALASR